jgi:hypothetical protein
MWIRLAPALIEMQCRSFPGEEEDHNEALVTFADIRAPYSGPELTRELVDRVRHSLIIGGIISPPLSALSDIYEKLYEGL